MKKIPYVNLKKQWIDEKKIILPLIDKSLASGNWVGGDEIKKFENNIKKYLKVKHVVAVNSGTDSLTIGLKLLGIKKGDEVITPSNSFVASTAAIVHLGAKPIFADVLEDQTINPKEIEKKINKKTKAIMPVHLTGRVCDMTNISSLSKKYKIPIIEDAAQSIGSKYKKKFAGTIGSIGCFSTHPLKNLNSFGDGGFLVTNNSNFSRLAKLYVNHGIYKRNKVLHFGYVSRMDNLQAAILNSNLKKLNSIIMRRRKNAYLYKKLLKNNSNVFVPKERTKTYNSYHTFVIQVKKRNKLKIFLQKKGIMTSVHYPIPIHLQPASSYLNCKREDLHNTEIQSKTILSLPINQYITKAEIIYITKMINNFYEKF